MHIVVQILYKILQQTVAEWLSWHFPQAIWPELSLHSLVLILFCKIQKCGNLDLYSWLMVKLLPVENVLLCT